MNSVNYVVFKFFSRFIFTFGYDILHIAIDFWYGLNIVFFKCGWGLFKKSVYITEADEMFLLVSIVICVDVVI